MIIEFNKYYLNNFSRSQMKIHQIIPMNLFDFIWEKLEFNIQKETLDAKSLMEQNLKES